MRDDILRQWPEANRILDELFDLDRDARARRLVELRLEAPALAPLFAAFVRAEAGAPRRFQPVLAALAAEGLVDDVPSSIGPYRIVGELGRGRTSLVLLAERDEPAGAPRVALKVLDTASWPLDVAHRVEREWVTLARLSHRHLARWLDAGVTGDGQPYLVMEHVDGQPIDRHCDAQRSSIDTRLRLVLQVCAAVAYAHGQRVVHHHLTPSNVLVDADGQARLLDLGLSAWLETSDGEGASDAATDVYQLGLLLFELVTGRRAHASATGLSAALPVPVPAVDPPRPSRVASGRIGARDMTLAAVTDRARRRGLTPAALARRLERHLDSVILKALSRDAAARYPTVEALARDVEAGLDGASMPAASR